MEHSRTIPVCLPTIYYNIFCWTPFQRSILDRLAVQAVQRRPHGDREAATGRRWIGPALAASESVIIEGRIVFALIVIGVTWVGQRWR